VPITQALFYECAPFKIHSALLVDPPWWAQFLIAIARVFMNKVREERESTRARERERERGRERVAEKEEEKEEEEEEEEEGYSKLTQ